MNRENFYEHLKFDDEPAREVGFNPYYPLLQGGLIDPLPVDGREFINLASNNYLGLAMDARVMMAAREGLEQYGVSLCSTPVAAGYSDLFREAEQALAAFEGLEAALILPSCYQANNGIFKMVARPADLIVVDRSAHSSLIEGIKAAGCKYRPFLNNDLDHLEAILKRSVDYGRIFVVTESVFSTEGSIAPFREIHELCERYGAIPVVDDSHGIGVLGSRGGGILDHCGIVDFQGIYLASLGKAMASSGGMIGGRRSLMEYIRYTMPHLLYSTAIIPAALRAVLEVIKILGTDYELLHHRLERHTRILRESLTRLGYDLTQGNSSIVSIRSGGTRSTLMLAKAMYDRGVIGTPFVYPSVREEEGRMRLIAGAGMSDSSLARALEVFGEIRNILK